MKRNNFHIFVKSKKQNNSTAILDETTFFLLVSDVVLESCFNLERKLVGHGVMRLSTSISLDFICLIDYFKSKRQ